MEENTPMQGVDTAPQDQPEGSVAAKGAANGELTDNAEAEGTTPAEAPEAERRRGGRRRFCHSVQPRGTAGNPRRSGRTRAERLEAGQTGGTDGDAGLRTGPDAGQTQVFSRGK